MLTEIHAAAIGSCVSLYMTKETVAAAGIVTIQATSISPTTFQLAPLPDATPPPTIEEAAACVVEIGMPTAVAPKIAVVAPMFAARPEFACSVVIFRPIVSMIFQPPQSVPRAIAAYADRAAHSGTPTVLPSAPIRVSRAEEERGDHAHRLLRVVGAVAEGDRAGGDQLEAP